MRRSFLMLWALCTSCGTIVDYVCANEPLESSLDPASVMTFGPSEFLMVAYTGGEIGHGTEVGALAYLERVSETEPGSMPDFHTTVVFRNGLMGQFRGPASDATWALPDGSQFRLGPDSVVPPCTTGDVHFTARRRRSETSVHAFVDAAKAPGCFVEFSIAADTPGEGAGWVSGSGEAHFHLSDDLDRGPCALDVATDEGPASLRVWARAWSKNGTSGRWIEGVREEEVPAAP